jgi:hypothetical protein
MRISIQVYVTGKRAAARIVSINPENPLHCGIELDEPQNIWGVHLPPNDWDEKSSLGDGPKTKRAGSRMKQEEARCPYCIVDDKFPPMAVLYNLHSPTTKTADSGCGRVPQTRSILHRHSPHD